MLRSVRIDMVRLGVLGLFIHGAGLAAFLTASRYYSLPALKFAIIGITGGLCLLLLWKVIARYESFWPTVAGSAILATDYSIAFHILGFLGFRGLLRDASSAGYFVVIIEVTAYVFIIYLTISACLLFLRRTHNTRLPRILRS